MMDIVRIEVRIGAPGSEEAWRLKERGARRDPAINDKRERVERTGKDVGMGDGGRALSEGRREDDSETS